ARRQAGQEASSGADDDNDPLGISGANQALSKPQGDEGSRGHGAGREMSKGGRSGGGGANKNKSVRV
ncbi:hypothetical protein E4U41_002819, partial [Claviceps citrina]